jgi:tetratricopeptide (TPR) repeat protein
MTGPEVVNDMATAFMMSTAQGLPLAEVLLNVLDAAEAAGGDRRGTQSAGLMIFEQRAIADYGDHALDLRVDESQNPLLELRRIYNASIAGNAASGLPDLITAGNYEEALARINASLELDPTRDAAYLQMADVYLAMGDTAKAIEALGESIALNPKAFNQILRDEDFEPIWADPAFLALGDISLFHPLAPSVPGGEGMPLPPMPDLPATPAPAATP